MSRESRAMLLNVLWHHQGGSSPVGQPLRTLLGIGQFDHLTDEQVSEAKWIDGLLSRGTRGVTGTIALADGSELREGEDYERIGGVEAVMTASRAPKHMEQELAGAEVLQRAYEWYEASHKGEAARALEMAVLRHKTALASGVGGCDA